MSSALGNDTSDADAPLNFVRSRFELLGFDLARSPSHDELNSQSLMFVMHEISSVSAETACRIKPFHMADDHIYPVNMMPLKTIKQEPVDVRKADLQDI